MKYLFTIFLFTFFTTATAKAQQCGNCNNAPRVVLYDAHVQVPKPTDADSLLKWNLLFQPATSIDVHVYQLNKDCPLLRVPFSKNEQGDETIRVSSTSTNVPSTSVDGDYFVTGYITPSGEQLMFQLQLKAACSGKIVASTSAPMPLTTDLTTLSNIVKQAASQISPIIDKIKEFELKERNGTKNFALGGSGGELIKITPLKQGLTAGQQTEIMLELKDCDGTALPGREIVFTQGSVSGLKITGTIGGTVSPSKVITDAQGKANATFKMAAGAGKPAIINAHTLTQISGNCEDALTGSAKVDMVPAYKVIVNYQKIVNGNVEMKSKDQIMSITMADETFQSSVFANASFYYYTKPGEKNIYIDQEKPATGLVFTDLRGYSEQQKIYKAPEMTVHPLGSSHKEGRDSVENIFSSQLLSTGIISVSFKGDELNAFQFDFNFKDDKNGNTPDSGGELVIRGDKDATFTKRKISDPASLFKTEHVIKYSKKTTESNQYGRSSESIFQEVIILSSF